MWGFGFSMVGIQRAAGGGLPQRFYPSIWQHCVPSGDLLSVAIPSPLWHASIDCSRTNVVAECMRQGVAKLVAAELMIGQSIYPAGSR